MSEIEFSAPAGASDEALALPDGIASGNLQSSAGELIRQAREAAGLHIAALAVSLKVPVKKLEALESGKFDLLPDAVFVRALAASVCRSLKIDAAPVLDRLPQTIAPKLTYLGAGINAPFRVPGDGPSPSLWAQVSRPAMLWGLALLLGALVLIILPSFKKGVMDARSAVASPGAVAPEGSKLFDTSLTASQEKTEPSGGTLSAPTDSLLMSMPAVAQAASAPALLATSSASPAASPVLPLPAAGASSGALPVAAVPNVLPNPTTSGIVVFSAKSESWVEVTDSRGTVVLRRILAAGEVVGASGALPLSAVVGRADATQVQIRGKALDLSPLARDNVARFEVK